MVFRFVSFIWLTVVDFHFAPSSLVMYSRTRPYCLLVPDPDGLIEIFNLWMFFGFCFLAWVLSFW